MTPNGSRSIVDAWKENVVAAAVAAAIGILVGIGVVWLLSILTTGDEPPIRVRNGSIQLEVLHRTRYWRQTGNVWKLSQGTRLEDSYWLHLAPTNAQDCKTNNANGNKIKFILDDGTEVVVESKNKKTEVSSTKPLTLSADQKVLSYGTPATFIKEIRFDGASDYLCQFGVKDANLHSLLTE